MTDHTPTQAAGDGAEPDVDRLIGRLVDGEASVADRERFDRLAALEPTLWKRLAETQGTDTLLAGQVELELAGVDQIELPQPHEAAGPAASDVAAGPAASDVAAGRTSSLAWSGWAAAIVLAAVWIVSSSIREPTRPLAENAISVGPTLSAEEHLQSYMRAPYVLGELDPMLLQADELSDGRIALRYLRRIEEVVFLDAEQPLPPAAEDGTLGVSPPELREVSPPVEAPAPDG